MCSELEKTPLELAAALLYMAQKDKPLQLKARTESKFYADFPGGDAPDSGRRRDRKGPRSDRKADRYSDRKGPRSDYKGELSSRRDVVHVPPKARYN